MSKLKKIVDVLVIGDVSQVASLRLLVANERADVIIVEKAQT